MGREYTREAKSKVNDTQQVAAKPDIEIESVQASEHLGSRKNMMLQMSGQAGAGDINTDQLRAGARMGVSGMGQPLPYLQTIQSSFGRHNVSQIQAHLDRAARKGTETIGAKAFASGEHVAFRSYPDLFMAAHEATHVVQQRGGVQLFGGIGRAHDPHEQHADAVAREVVAGRSAEPLLDRYASQVGHRSSPQTGEQLQFWGEPDHYIMGQEAGKIAYNKLSSYKLLDDSFKLKEHEKDPSQKKSYKPDGKKIVESESKDRFVVRGPDKGVMSYGAANRFAGDLSPRARGKSTRGHSLENWAEEVTKKGSDYLSLGMFGEYSLLGTNANHFYPLAGVEYRRNHAIAKQKMWIALELRDAATGSEDMKVATEIARQAIVLEGFASHFLADCFAAGHLSPHALGRIGEGIGKSGPLVNTWHDLLNALPGGVPTTLGRFHGDYSMDGHDLKYLSNVISNSLLEIAMPWYTGRPYNPAIILPKPDLAKIRRDPVVGPIWARMCGDYKGGLEKQLKRERRKGKKGLSKYAIYQTTGDHQVSQEEAIAPILADVFGGSPDGPTRIDDTNNEIPKIRGKVHALVTALHQVMAYKGGWQTEVGITQGYEPTDYKKQDTYKFRTDFKSAKLAAVSPASAPIVPLGDELKFWVGQWNLHAQITDTKKEEELRESLIELADVMIKGAKGHKEDHRKGVIGGLAKALETLGGLDVDHGVSIEKIDQGPEAVEKRREERQEAIEAFRLHKTPIPKVDIPKTMSVSPVMLNMSQAHKIFKGGGVDVVKALASVSTALNQLAMDPCPEEKSIRKLLYTLLEARISNAMVIAHKAAIGKALGPVGILWNGLDHLRKTVKGWHAHCTTVDIISETARRNILADMPGKLGPYFEFSKERLELATARII